MGASPGIQAIKDSLERSLIVLLKSESIMVKSLHVVEAPFVLAIASPRAKDLATDQIL
jgi:hypothetical protein